MPFLTFLGGGRQADRERYTRPNLTASYKHLSHREMQSGIQAASGRWLNDPIYGLYVRQPAAVYEDWYRSAWLALLDHQMDWYYSPSLDEDKVTVMILNTRACQKQKIICCRWLREHFRNCPVNVLGRCRSIWCRKPEFTQRNFECGLNCRPRLENITVYSFIMINTYTQSGTKQCTYTNRHTRTHTHIYG